MPAIIVAPVLVGDEVPSYLVTIDPAENLFGEDMSLLVPSTPPPSAASSSAASAWWPRPPAGPR